MRSFLTASALLICFSASAQTLRGHVTDAGTGAPLPYATLLVARLNTGVTADSAGRFRMTPRERPDSVTVSCGLCNRLLCPAGRHRQPGCGATAAPANAAAGSGGQAAAPRRTARLPGRLYQ
ncbi:MAG: hypothetical protein EOO11_23430 [Chitinophagaceae bacterium]|nr:MAG: hypothetical protein EOO11_23430 [Chitinophagaceae bacterium]